MRRTNSRRRPSGISPVPVVARRTASDAYRSASQRNYRQPAQKILPRGCSLISFKSCLFLLLIGGGIGVVWVVYLMLPLRTNILLMGIDYTEPDSAVARSDTLVLSTFMPARPYVGLLSIPRDLWVVIPGFGSNRINTAHFTAENLLAGSGPYMTMHTIRLNFGVQIDYYARIRFEGFRDVVDALGGVDIELSEPMAGYEAGKYHLTGRKALAFVRHRQGSDDFFRMQHAQSMMKALFKNMLNPLKWFRLPGMARAFFNSVDTNLPVWMWPKLAFTLLRVGPDGIDNRTITRQMTTPFTTNEGAQVLLPNWELIVPTLKEMFEP